MTEDRELEPVEQAVIDAVRKAGSLPADRIEASLQDDIEVTDVEIKQAIVNLKHYGILEKDPEMDGEYVVIEE